MFRNLTLMIVAYILITVAAIILIQSIPALNTEKTQPWSIIIMVFGLIALSFWLFRLPFKASARKAERLLQQGTPGTAEVLDVSDSGWTVNDNPVIKIRLRIQTQTGSLEGEAKMMISRIKLPPKAGDVLQIKYDPSKPTDFVIVEDTSQPPQPENPTVKSQGFGIN